jgi:predicted Zn-dependent protease
MKRFFPKWAQQGLALWVLGAYIFISTFGWMAPREVQALSLSDEKKLGRKTMEQIRDHFSLIEDGEIIAYVQAVGNRIAEQLGTTTYSFQFYVIDEPIPNAFAVPGGYIFLYRGLIEMMESEGELASILAHELSHIEARHIHDRIAKGRTLSIASVAAMLAAAFLGGGGEGAQALAMGAMAGSQSLQLQYSRENEAEADQLGFRHLIAAGYDPKDMISMMQRLNRYRWIDSSRIPSYLSTHPAADERVQYLRSIMQSRDKYDPKKLVRREPVGDFALMQAALISDYAEKEAALERFASWEGQENRRAAAAYGKGRVYVRHGQYDQAIPPLQEAVRLAPGSSMILSTLGYAYFQQGRAADAQKAFQTALLMDPKSAIVHYRLALVLQDQGQKAGALEHLQQAEPLTPIFPEIDYHLGVVLGQTDQIGLAHYHLGRYYQHQRDWKTAEFHYNKAKPLLVSSVDKRIEIDDALEDIKAKKKGPGMEPTKKEK